MLSKIKIFYSEVIVDSHASIGQEHRYLVYSLASFPGGKQHFAKSELWTLRQSRDGTFPCEEDSSCCLFTATPISFLHHPLINPWQPARHLYDFVVSRMLHRWKDTLFNL